MPVTRDGSAMCSDQAAAESSTFCSKPASVSGQLLHDGLEACLLFRREVHAGEAEVADRQLDQAFGAFATGVAGRWSPSRLYSSYRRWLWPSSVA